MPDEPERFPAVPGNATVAEVVIDGEIVEDAEPSRQLVPAPVRAVASHPHARLAARHAAYVAAGFIVAVRRWHARRTRHERTLRMLEAQGNHEAMLQWRQQAEAERKGRAERRRDRAETARALVPVVLWGIPVAAALPGALGICLAFDHHDPLYVAQPYFWVMDAVGTAWAVASAVWFAATFAVPACAVAWLHHLGRTRIDLPFWLMTAAQRDQHEGDPVTPSVLVTALRDLGIPVLRKAVQEADDGAAQMLGMITSAGCGIEVDVYLPSGVSTSEVRGRREKLAENVGRHVHELFMTVPGRPRTVRLWIADSGALDEPIGPSPLVTDQAARAHYRTGRAPWGQSLRGEPSAVSVFQRHVLVTGISNHGKTAALRALALWLSLDPRARFWIADFKGVGDWNMFDGIAEVLIQGPTDEHVARGTHMAEAGVTEMQERTTLMQELSGQGWAQEKILADPGFAPLVLIFDEAQKAYGCGAVADDGRPYGGTKNTSRYFQAIKAIHDQGRAVNVTTWEGTQDPTNENLPKRTREGNHVRASLVVGTEAQAAMALGENAVAAGAAPHELRQGADKGVVVVAGDVTAFDAPRGQTFAIIRTHFIGDADAAAIAARATALRGRSVRAQAVPAIESRDLLADLGELTRGDGEPVRLPDLARQLQRMAPHWAAYKGLTGVRLGELLDGEHVRWTNTGNVARLDPADLRSALARRGGELGGRRVPEVPSGDASEASA